MGIRNHNVVVDSATSYLAQLYPTQSFEIRLLANTLMVEWCDGMPERTIYDELKKFEHRDPATAESIFCQQHGHVEYVVVSRRYSDSAITEALQHVSQQHNLSAQGVTVSLAALASGALNAVIPADSVHDIPKLLARYLKGRDFAPVNTTQVIKKGRIQAITIPKQSHNHYLVRLAAIRDKSRFLQIDKMARQFHGRYLSKAEGAGYYGFVFSSKSDADAFNQSVSA